MNTPLFAAACALAGGSLHAQATLHVAPDGAADGSSWAAPASLHGALASASPGDVLYLKAGTYVTSPEGDRAVSFRVPDGVRVLGGFRGDEADEDHRDPVAFAAVLSGEIGSPDREDNAYTVAHLSGVGTGTVLDGLTLIGGYASGAGGSADPRRAGGGLLVDLARPGGTTAPQIIDCVFAANYARDGGGAYVSGRAGVAKPTFEGCTFRDNEADLDGGAMFVDGRRHGVASPTLTECRFEGNVANYGGAVFNQATGGTTHPRLVKCGFARNRAYVRGATLYAIDHRGSAAPLLEGCVFDEPTGVRPADASALARAID